MNCYIFGAGEYSGSSFTYNEDDFIIAADAGYEVLKKLGVEPHMVVGDFDSCSTVPNHKNVIHLNREKDDTDMGIAVQYGLKHGCKQFIIYGGTGNRFSHTMANIQLLSSLSMNGCQGFLIGPREVMTSITSSSISFGPQCSGYISVFSMSDVSNDVNISGLKYELSHKLLVNFHALGVSNEFIGQPSSISVGTGSLLIVTGKNNYPYIKTI